MKNYSHWKPYTKERLAGIKSVKNKLETKEYKLIPNPCPCGNKKGSPLSLYDRSGISASNTFCLECSLIRIDPYFDDKSLRQFYKNEYRGITTSAQKCNDRIFYKEMESRGKDIFYYCAAQGLVKSKSKVLEIGASAGWVLEHFKEAGMEVIGTDWDEQYVEFGNSRGLNLLKGDHQKVLPNGYKADLIILSMVLEHVPKPKKFLDSIIPYLNKGGKLVIAVPGVEIIEKSYHGDLQYYFEVAHVYSYNLYSLDYVLSLSGFKRVVGDHRIRAVYEYKNIKPLPKYNDLDFLLGIWMLKDKFKHPWKYYKFVLRNYISLILGKVGK